MMKCVKPWRNTVRKAIQRTHRYWENSTRWWLAALVIAIIVAGIVVLNFKHSLFIATLIVAIPLVAGLIAHSHKINAEKLLEQDDGT